MIDSATIDEAVDLLECAGWKGYAKAVRELKAQLTALTQTIDQDRQTIAALRAEIARLKGRR